MTSKSLHPALALQDDIKELCKLLECLNINYFAHVNVDEHGRFSGLNNNPEFLECYIRNKYYNADIHLAQDKNIGKYILWDALDDLGGQTNSLDEDAAGHGVEHVFTIVEKGQDEKNFYHFGSNMVGKSINHEYLRNLDLLKKFIMYFHEQINASNQLLNVYNKKYTIDQSEAKFEVSSELVNFDKKNKLAMLKAMGEQMLLPLDIRQRLSVREIECLKLYIAGKSAKEISNLLSLSARTVENYINNIKSKLKIFSKSELINRCNEKW
jgi:DNA-binding CsgD family transcriptional regulator